MKSVALHNLGCKVNAYEMDFMQQMLQEKGYKIVPFDEAADIYIVNTCTVTNIADRKSRQMLHRARALNPDAVVVAVGCYVQTGQESLEADGTVDIAIGNNKKGELVQILEDYLNGRQAQIPAEGSGAAGQAQTPAEGRKRRAQIHKFDIGQVTEYEELALRETADHTRAFLKIQDGCNQFCTYCIIPYARGRIRSRRQEDVLAEARRLTEAGYRELVLTGIHLSSYGMEKIPAELSPGAPQSGSELLLLLRELSALAGVERIRLGSLEPGIVTEDFAEGLHALPKVCPHFHLSLQSGSDTVLRRMNRKYDTEAYLAAVTRLRNCYGNPAITTDVIVGFPGETEAEFQETVDFAARVGFYEMHIFKYSRRQGTPAADMAGQLTEAQKAKRSGRLMELEREMSRAFRAAFVGKEEPVLFEECIEREDGNWWIGHTPHYVRVACKAQTEEKTEVPYCADERGAAQYLANRIVSCRVTGFLEEDILLAKPV